MINNAFDFQYDLISLQFVIKTLQIRIPDQLRHDADLVLADIGLDMPTAVRLYLAKIVQTRSIPFSLTAAPVPVAGAGAEGVTQNQIDEVEATWAKRKKTKADGVPRKGQSP